MQQMRFAALLVFLVVAVPALAGPGGAAAPPAGAKCPVCGMFVGKYANWLAVAVYRDGTTVYFDGPKDLFTYYLDQGKYDPSRKRTDIAALYVKDYYKLASIDARRALFVVGSDVLGPMGKELVPMANKVDAAEFMRDHKGKRVVRFDEVTPALLKSLQ